MYRVHFKIELDATLGGIDVGSTDEATAIAKEQAQKLYDSFQRALKRKKYHTEGKVKYLISYEE